MSGIFLFMYCEVMFARDLFGEFHYNFYKLHRQE